MPWSTTVLGAHLRFTVSGIYLESVLPAFNLKQKLSARSSLGTLDELFKAATLLESGKVGPPLILVGLKFWRGKRDFLLFMG
jgi:hypothetical protein